MASRNALGFATILGSVLLLAGCQEDGGFISTSGKALKPLGPEITKLMTEKGMRKEDPILVRVFKEDSKLEVWKRDKSGEYALLKDYKICAWGGTLGPKIQQGDKQSPEGFYSVKPWQMNPNSSYHLSYDIGFPNAFDKAWGRTGGDIMVHGACSSAGCFAMTDEQVEEIYGLAREAFAGGQPAFQVQSFPFRMTAKNMAAHRSNPNMAFWKNLKEGYDHFEVTKLEPKVDFCEKRYVFNAQPKDTLSTTFNAANACPTYEVPQHIALAVAAKQKADEEELRTVVASLDQAESARIDLELQKKLEAARPKQEGNAFASLFSNGQPAPAASAAPSPAFAMTPISVPLPKPSPLRETSAPVVVAAAKPEPDMVSRIFGFGASEPPAQGQPQPVPASTTVLAPPPPVTPPPAMIAAPVPAAKPVQTAAAAKPAEPMALTPKPEKSFWERWNPFGS